MTSIAHKQSDSTVLSSYTYGYDDAGQRTYVKRANGNGDVYEYDATDQLTNVLYEASNPDTSPSSWTNQVGYVFDAAGNRTSVNITNIGTTSYAANELNQYTNIGGATPSYDDNGNLSFDGSVWHYYYDRENRLLEADDLSTDIIYVYDAFNRLIARSVSGGATTRFYYDDQWRVIAEYDENDSLVAKYVYGPEIDEPVQMAHNGTNYYYHAAALGTVTEITLDDQSIVERYAYDVYGEPQIWDGSGNLLSASAIGNRLLFQGRDRDPDTGLYNFRNRYYSPSLGRFVQTDPIRDRGDLNLYAFVQNHPINSADPNGLEIYPTEAYEFKGGEGPFACAKRIEAETQHYCGGVPNDSHCHVAHCIAACRISRECAGWHVAAYYGGIWHEWKHGWDRDESPGDVWANVKGIAKSCIFWKNCEEQCMNISRPK